MSLLPSEQVLHLVRGEKKVQVPFSQIYLSLLQWALWLEWVPHKVDCHYCPSCLENMPSPEVKLKKNKCANCFDCTGCSHTISIQARSITTQLPDDPVKITMKKAHHLANGFCHWTSRDVGMAEKSGSSDRSWEPENPYMQQMNKLIKYYQQLVHKENVEWAWRNLTLPTNYISLAFLKCIINMTDKYCLGIRLQGPQIGTTLSSTLAGLSFIEEEDQKEIKIDPSQAVDEMELLPEDSYTRPTNLTEMTTLQQHLLQPGFHPIYASQLCLRHKHFLIKWSLCCRKCEPDLRKPEFNPISIKFKIQLFCCHLYPRSENHVNSQPFLHERYRSSWLLWIQWRISPMWLLVCEEENPE